MARTCDLCGKGPKYGNHISHAHNVTKRRWNPNLRQRACPRTGRAQDDQGMHGVHSFGESHQSRLTPVVSSPSSVLSNRPKRALPLYEN